MVPEQSFRRGRTLTVLRDGKVNAPPVLPEPDGLLAKIGTAYYRRGCPIACRQKWYFLPGREQGKLEERFCNLEDSDDTTAVTEPVYALWVTYSRPIHVADPVARILPFPTPTSKPTCTTTLILDQLPLSTGSAPAHDTRKWSVEA